MSCECHQIGGRFIAEDPDCPVHGTEAQQKELEKPALVDRLMELADAYRNAKFSEMFEHRAALLSAIGEALS